jgi:3-oxoacyl-[acyl-carrier-protein] synthase-1
MRSSRTNPPLAILGYGLCTPLGLTAKITSAEMAAGTTAFAETEIANRTGDPVRAARLPLIPAQATRMERMTQLARTALADLASDPPAELKDGRMPLILALPDSSEGGAPIDPDEASLAITDPVREIRPDIGQQRRGSRSAGADAVFRGRSAFFTALDEAQRFLTSDAVDAVLIGAADSLSDPLSLQGFGRANRVLSSANPDGLLPGEAAGFIIIGRYKSRGTRGRLVAQTSLRGPGLVAEPASIGQGLSDVFRRLGDLSPVRASHVFSAQTSDRRWSRELSIAMLRAPHGMPEPFASSRVTATLGDPGAGGALVLTIASMGSPLVGPDGPALVYAISDDGMAGGLLAEAA